MKLESLIEELCKLGVEEETAKHWDEYVYSILHTFELLDFLNNYEKHGCYVRAYRDVRSARLQKTSVAVNSAW